MIVHLRPGGNRRVAHREQALGAQLSALGLKAQHVGGHAEVGDFPGNVIHLDFDRVGAGRGHLVIGDALVDSADQVRAAAVGELETEFSGAVRLGLGGDFHAVG
jgi:hypothetical protein